MEHHHPFLYTSSPGPPRRGGRCEKQASQGKMNMEESQRKGIWTEPQRPGVETSHGTRGGHTGSSELPVGKAERNSTKDRPQIGPQIPPQLLPALLRPWARSPDAGRVRSSAWRKNAAVRALGTFRSKGLIRSCAGRAACLVWGTPRGLLSSGSTDPQAQGPEGGHTCSPPPQVAQARARRVRAPEHCDLQPKNRKFRSQAVPLSAGIPYKHLRAERARVCQQLWAWGSQ